MSSIKTFRFRLNGGDAQVTVSPTMSLQRVLRDVLGLTGTKDGCREGECGACTVLLDRAPVDSCIVPICHVDGREVITIEAFSGREADSHPLVSAFVSQGAVQCGFCTPGMIISAAGLLIDNPDPSPAEIEAGLAGNLCRCTGYEKIVSAVKNAAESLGNRGSRSDRTILPPMTPRHYTGQTSENEGISVIRPESLADIDVLAADPSTLRFLAGGTDLMVQKTNRKPCGEIWIDLSGLKDLRGISLVNGSLRIGPQETYHAIATHPLVRRFARALAESASMIGSDHIMRRATIGGNLGNAAACADGYPPLTALHAQIRTRLRGETRIHPVESIPVANGRSNLKPGELITDIVIPVGDTMRSVFHKSMPRHAQCIAKVSLAISISLIDGKIDNPGFAMGAVGPTVIRVREAEAMMAGQTLLDIDRNAIARAAVQAARPINDFRSDVDYRLRIVELETLRLLQVLSD